MDWISISGADPGEALRSQLPSEDEGPHGCHWVVVMVAGILIALFSAISSSAPETAPSSTRGEIARPTAVAQRANAQAAD